jgi:hypothetical protein
MNVETGYLAPAARAHPERNLVVHARLIGGERTFCGARIGEPLDFQFTARGDSFEYLNCQRCRASRHYRAAVAVSTAQRMLAGEQGLRSRARRGRVAAAEAVLTAQLPELRALGIVA